MLSLGALVTNVVIDEDVSVADSVKDGIEEIFNVFDVILGISVTFQIVVLFWMASGVDTVVSSVNVTAGGALAVVSGPILTLDVISSV